MSLYKQLALLITALFILLFAGTFLVNFSSTQSFLIEQMETQTEDTATALGLSLIPYLTDSDVAGILTTVNAVFDRSYYEAISVTDANGIELVSREQPIVIDGVPAWFINFVNIEAPIAQRELSAGWALGGTIMVAGHPGYAYQQLWRVVTSSFIWALIGAVCLLVLGSFSLKALLVPLVAVTRQAEAICNRVFDIQVALPRTTELRTVVTAMNKMTNNVKTTFEEQTQTANRLRKLAYQDPLTGIGNKRHFQAQLQSLLEDEHAFQAGAMLLLQLNDYKGYNQRNGYQKGDKVLVELSATIKHKTAAFPACILARLNGGDFAIYIPGITMPKAESLTAELSKELADLHTKEFYDISSVGHIGLVMVDEPEAAGGGVGKVLSQADVALRLAQGNGDNSWYRLVRSSEAAANPTDRSNWTQYLTRVVENNELTLLTQKVVDSHDANSILHRETFVQINDENGDPCPAGLFMTSAEQLGLSQKIDRFVISRIVQHLLGLDNKLPIPFAINLSLNTLQDSSFQSWLLPVLKQLSGAASKRIIFEFSESMVINNLEPMRQLSSALQELGHGIGLDHFGRGFSDFGYLKTLRPDYVKIDRAYTLRVNEDQDTQFFVTTLCSICKSLEIQVIAQAVEDQEQWDTLKALHVDGVQGYGIGKPNYLQH